MVRLDGRLRGVVVNDVQLYGRANMIGRWFHGLGREFEANAKALAPVGKAPKGPSKRPPGNLKASIRVTTTRTGPRQLQNELTIGANYARFVVRGVPGIIDHPTGMKIYWQQLGKPGYGKGTAKKPKKGSFHVRQVVRGQRRNAFLDRASRVTAARHPSIRGLTRRRIGVR